MTTKEKLEKALEALRRIKDNEVKNMFLDTYAAKVYEELTTPRTKTVEVKRWEIRNVPTHGFKERGDAIGFCNRTATPHSHIIELIGTDTRPIPEPETWEGEVIVDLYERPCILDIPKEWIGKRIIAEVCE